MTFLATAFVAVWLLVALYVAYMGIRPRRIEDEVKTLEEIVGER